MATITLTGSDEAALRSISPQGGTYSDARDSETATSISGPPTASFRNGHHHQTGPPIYYWVLRDFILFDATTIPESAIVISATLRLYGFDDDSDDNYDVTIVEGPDTGGSPVSFGDFNDFGSISYGSKNTSTLSVGAWNEFAITAAGLAFINTSLQTGTVYLGIRNGNEIDNIVPSPDQKQSYSFEGSLSSNPPELILTIANWPNDIYPEAVIFPISGKVDPSTYSVIKNYLEGIYGDLAVSADDNGNINLAVANWITWDGTGEKIAYDNSTGHVTLTSLESTSVVSVSGDLTTDDLTSTTLSAGDSTVANVAQLSDAVYADIQAQVTDDELVFSGISAPTPTDDTALFYMDSTSGDFIARPRDDGQAGTKTAILGDFSGM